MAADGGGSTATGNGCHDTTAEATEHEEHDQSDCSSLHSVSLAGLAVNVHPEVVLVHAVPVSSVVDAQICVAGAAVHVVVGEGITRNAGFCSVFRGTATTGAAKIVGFEIGVVKCSTLVDFIRGMRRIILPAVVETSSVVIGKKIEIMASTVFPVVICLRLTFAFDCAFVICLIKCIIRGHVVFICARGGVGRASSALST